MSVDYYLLRSFLAIALACAPAYSQVSDVTPPALLSFSFSPLAIDTRSGPQNVTFTADVSDDLSGSAQSLTISLNGPNNQLQTVLLARTSGTAILGRYTATYPFPQFTASGIWQVEVRPIDVVGNAATLSAAALQARDFPASLTVISTPDTTPPQIQSLQFTPATPNTSARPVNVTMRMRLTDTLAGLGLEKITGCNCDFRMLILISPSAKQWLRLNNTDFRLVSGTHSDGFWEATFAMPRYSEPGLWTVQQLRLLDKVNNLLDASASSLTAAGLPSGFTVSSNPADTDLPVLTGLTLSPLTIDASVASQTVIITFGLQDNLSGIDFSRQPICPCQVLGVLLRSPSGNQVRTSTLSPFTQLSGTILNGTWSGTVVLPRFAEPGTWSAQVYIKDRARNERFYPTTELQTLGFPSSLVVFRPSYIPDGTIGSLGGTITDQIFGSLAELSIPIGALTGPTSISIDVLQNPPNIAIPQGFSSALTSFVNVDLVPHPTAAIGPPGYTLTIPLVNPQPAGVRMDLFRLDPMTGNLARARSVSASPVTGTVDPGGQSATFTGIASFSTVVGLPASSQKPGDVNGDSTVNCADVSFVRAAFGKRTGQSGFDARADMNRDGIINISDLSYVLQQLPAGSSCP